VLQLLKSVSYRPVVLCRFSFKKSLKKRVFQWRTLTHFASAFLDKPHTLLVLNCLVISLNSRSQWPRGLRCRSAAARLLRSRVRIPPGAWICVCCECCVLSGRGLCDELITRPEESLCVVVCDLEPSRIRRP
jgi:hypothetical protein